MVLVNDDVSMVESDRYRENDVVPAESLVILVGPESPSALLLSITADSESESLTIDAVGDEL